MIVTQTQTIVLVKIRELMYISLLAICAKRSMANILVSLRLVPQKTLRDTRLLVVSLLLAKVTHVLRVLEYVKHLKLTIKELTAKVVVTQELSMGSKVYKIGQLSQVS